MQTTNAKSEKKTSVYFFFVSLITIGISYVIYVDKPEPVRKISDDFTKIYSENLLPVEKKSFFHLFHSTKLENVDFSSKPMILLVGQYSTGKTSFIRHLINSDFPGIEIGPQPAADQFRVIMNGMSKNEILGNALMADPATNFGQLSVFGNAFLKSFKASILPNKLLENVTFIDTPGILAGEKRELNRGYDFGAVIEWFADRSDRIILMFDPSKLDIPDNFKSYLEKLERNQEKIKVVLNKAHSLSNYDLIRVYGALMWSLSRVFQTPEAKRIFISSFEENVTYFNQERRRLIESDSKDLLLDLSTLPINANLRKLNDFIKRARLVKVNFLLVFKFLLFAHSILIFAIKGACLHNK